MAQDTTTLKAPGVERPEALAGESWEQETTQEGREDLRDCTLCAINSLVIFTANKTPFVLHTSFQMLRYQGIQHNYSITF